MLDKVILVSSLRTEQGTIKVAQWVMAPAIRPDELSSTPGTHMMEKEPTPEPSMWVHTHTHTLKNLSLKKDSWTRLGGVAQFLECLPGILEVLVSILSTT